MQRGSRSHPILEAVLLGIHVSLVKKVDDTSTLDAIMEGLRDCAKGPPTATKVTVESLLSRHGLDQADSASLKDAIVSRLLHYQVNSVAAP